MVPVPGSGPRLSGCRGPAAPSCSLQMQTQSPFLEGKNDTTKGKITLRVLNQIWNQRLQNNINSSFARKNASEMVFQRWWGGWLRGKPLHSRNAQRMVLASTPLWPPPPEGEALISQPSRSTHPCSLGHLSDCDQESQGQLYPTTRSEPTSLLPH